MQLIDGKQTAAEIRAQIASEVNEMTANGMRKPHLAAILVGHDGGSETYVASKIKACAECGFKSSLIRFENTVSQTELLAAVEQLNNDSEIDGFIVQLPLPRHIDEHAVIEAIDPKKDVDGFHPVNIGRMTVGLPAFLPATPAGILDLLARYDIDTDGKNVVIIGRSNIVGKPLASMLMQKSRPGNATVTVCHSATRNIADITRRADIVICALGKPHFLTSDMVSAGVSIIDVGTTRVPDASKRSGFRLCGDVDFENVAHKCNFITPVPGGVGPMTITRLMKNTLLAATGAVYPKINS